MTKHYQVTDVLSMHLAGTTVLLKDGSSAILDKHSPSHVFRECVMVPCVASKFSEVCFALQDLPPGDDENEVVAIAGTTWNPTSS